MIISLCTNLAGNVSVCERSFVLLFITGCSLLNNKMICAEGGRIVSPNIADYGAWGTVVSFPSRAGAQLRRKRICRTLKDREHSALHLYAEIFGARLRFRGIGLLAPTAPVFYDSITSPCSGERPIDNFSQA